MNFRTLVAAFAMFGAVAPTFALDGNAADGKKKNSMCIGCHGIPGYRTVFPEVYTVPKISGQNAPYLVKALQAYKTGARSHPSMRGVAGSLSDQDMADLAAYYAAADMQTVSSK